ncbi:hypothetical protein [uncultured Sphingomonas sp.]|uniref:hypothetical protein n=1 Tax=uncultured Sphingomonas sp. TaxID=158754 RepID=UPI0025F2B323|nr:hypothetical protein [uncultured Sphingomonas sp.]
MSRLSLGDLPMPPRCYRIDLMPDSRFETEAEAQKEDETRARRLRNYLGRPSSEQAACTRLAGVILGSDTDDHRSLASAVVMRLHRIKITGGLWPLCQRERTYFVTLIPRGFSVTPDELMGIDPTKKNQWLRMTLARLGAKSDTDGWIYAYLEGEYNPVTGMIQLHWHLIMTHSAMRKVIEQLREHSAFKRTIGACNNSDRVDVRVMVKQVDQDTLPEIVSYATKAAWYSKWRADDETGARKSQKGKCRIPEPALSKVLLWLDRWRVGDMTMLLNLHVTKNGIAPR